MADSFYFYKNLLLTAVWSNKKKKVIEIEINRANGSKITMEKKLTREEKRAVRNNY